MATVVINHKSLQKKLGHSRRVKSKLAKEEVLPRARYAQEDMIQAFEDHAITREIDSGPHSINLSNTLSNAPGGNLFSFLGFYDGDDPIEEVRQKLDKPISLRKVEYISGAKYKITLQGLPDKQEIFSSTQLPWLSGRSWIDGIEHGIAGFGQYLILSPRKQPSKSRSGTAIQTKSSVRRGGFKNTPYLSSILNEFHKSLRKLNAISV